MNKDLQIFNSLPSQLQSRLESIAEKTSKFWESKLYSHFTNQGTAHSERVFRLLAQLAQELPAENRLNEHEIFIITAAARLYEVGLQSPNLKPVLDFEYKPGETLSFAQLQEIRAKKHLLTRNLIYDSVRNEYRGTQLDFGLKKSEKYVPKIAEICRWVSDDPFNDVPENDVVGAVPIRFRLLVALLRMADQLYIDSSRVNLDILEISGLSDMDYVRWWAYHYTQVLPPIHGLIRFHYFLPSSQREYLGHIRAIIESNFKFDNNSTIRYLWDYFPLRLVLSDHLSISRFDQSSDFQRLMSSKLTEILRRAIQPIPIHATMAISGDPTTDAPNEDMSEDHLNDIEKFVFISYAHNHRNYASKLYKHLQEEGIGSWFDDLIEFGSEWEKVLDEKLQEAQAVIFIITPDSVSSPTIKAELEKAKAQNKIIYPFLLEDVEENTFSHLRYVDVRGGQLPPASFLHQLKAAGFSNRLAGDTTVDAPPPEDDEKKTRGK
jgi:hypothetical protein